MNYTELESKKVITFTLTSSKGEYLNRGLLPGFTVMENALADITRMNISFDLNNIEGCPPYRVSCYGKDYRSDRAHMVSCGCCGDDRLGNDMSSSEYIHDLDYSKGVNLWVLWYKFPISRILFQWTESNDRRFHYFFMEFLRDVWKEFYVPSKGNSPLFLVRM